MSSPAQSPGAPARPARRLRALLAGPLLLTSLFLASLRLAAGPELLSEKQLTFLENAGRGRISGRWIEAGTNELVALRLKGEAVLADLTSRHLAGGLVVSKRWTDTNRTTAAAYENVELAAGLTGHLLGGLAYWFSVDLRPEALERIRNSLTGLETLATVSGRPGYIAAFAAPASDPAFRATYPTLGGPDPARPGFGRLAHAGGPAATNLVWISANPRENLAQVVFGLGSVHRRIREPKIRQRTATLIDSIISRLEADRWRIVDGRGSEEYVPPLLKAAILRAGASVNPDRHSKAAEAATRDALDYPPLFFPKFGDSTQAAHALANLVTLTSLDTNETRRLGFQSRLTQIWRKNGSELNPWLAAAYANGFDRAPKDTLVNATLQGVLQAYPAPPRWQRSAPPVPTNAPLVEANGESWLRDSRPIHLQPTRPFAWDGNPRQFHPGTNTLVTHSGVDFFTTFWMARDAGVIPHEDAARTNTVSSRTRRTAPPARPELPIPPTATNKPPAPAPLQTEPLKLNPSP